MVSAGFQAFYANALPAYFYSPYLLYPFLLRTVPPRCLEAPEIHVWELGSLHNNRRCLSFYVVPFSCFLLSIYNHLRQSTKNISCPNPLLQPPFESFPEPAFFPFVYYPARVPPRP